MGIRYVWPTHGELYPQIACDVCGKAIEKFSDGNVAWLEPPDNWEFKGEWTTDQVYFSHKECDHILRHMLRQRGINSTYWEELRLFPIHLMYNGGMHPAATAAFEARTPTKMPESVQGSGLALRFAILKRDGYRCQLCGRSAKNHGVVLEVDHKIARAKGGADKPSNLWTLCFDCNRGKSDSAL